MLSYLPYECGLTSAIECKFTTNIYCDLILRLCDLILRLYILRLCDFIFRLYKLPRFLENLR